MVSGATSPRSYTCAGRSLQLNLGVGATRKTQPQSMQCPFTMGVARSREFPIGDLLRSERHGIAFQLG